MLPHTFRLPIFGFLVAFVAFGVVGKVSAQHNDEFGLANNKTVEKGGDLWVYFDLGCGGKYWSGYFAPQRWQRTVGNQKDTFSDFSESADFDANEGVMRFAGPRETEQSWTIEVPVAGYLSFLLVPSDSIELSLNGNTEVYSNQGDSIYFSPYLQAGDRFSLRFPAGQDTILWQQLRFHTNSTGVFFRPGKETINERYRGVEGTRIDRILFPSDSRGQWPLFDYDGDFNTLSDQIELRESDDQFDLVYHDEVVADEGQYFLRRVFQVKEHCEMGNTITHAQPWWPLPLLAEPDTTAPAER